LEKDAAVRRTGAYRQKKPWMYETDDFE